MSNLITWKCYHLVNVVKFVKSHCYYIKRWFLYVTKYVEVMALLRSIHKGRPIWMEEGGRRSENDKNYRRPLWICSLQLTISNHFQWSSTFKLLNIIIKKFEIILFCSPAVFLVGQRIRNGPWRNLLQFALHIGIGDCS